MSPQTWWYLSRASAIVAWLMMTASVLWGIVLASGAFPSHRRPAWLLDLHRWLGTLTVAFLAVHLGSLVADSYLHFGLAELTVPFASEWRPVAVAAGVLAMWGLVAVQGSSLLQRRMPRPVWRGIHFASYPTWLLVCLHGVFAGTDASSRLYLLTSVASVAAVGSLLVHRVATRGSRRRGRGRGRASARPRPDAMPSAQLP